MTQLEEVKFQCPKCKYTEVEEVLVNACVSSIIARIYPKELEYQNGYEVWDGNVDRYQCAKCGLVIAKTVEELYAVCNGMQGEKQN